MRRALLPLAVCALLLTLAPPADAQVAGWAVDVGGYTHFIGDTINVTVVGAPGALPLIQFYNETYALDGAPLRIDLGPFGNRTTLLVLYTDAYRPGLHYVNVTVNDTLVCWTTVNLVYDHERVQDGRIEALEDDIAELQISDSQKSHDIRLLFRQNSTLTLLLVVMFFFTVLLAMMYAYDVWFDKRRSWSYYHGTDAGKLPEQRFARGRVHENNVGARELADVESIDATMRRLGVPDAVRADVGRVMLGRWGYVIPESPVMALGPFRIYRASGGAPGVKKPGLMARWRARRAAKKGAKP